MDSNCVILYIDKKLFAFSLLQSLVLIHQYVLFVWDELRIQINLNIQLFLILQNLPSQLQCFVIINQFSNSGTTQYYRQYLKTFVITVQPFEVATY